MRIRANGIDVEYRIEGPPAAPVVMFSHPLAATLEVWDAQAAALTGRYRVLRYDARGHGGSAVPPGPYTLAEMASDAVALLDALGIAQVHFVGLSMGGCVGMTAALDHASRFKSLVLADTTSQYAPETGAMWEQRIRGAERDGMAPIVEPTMEIWFSAGFREAHKGAVDRVRAMLHATDPRGYIAAIRAIAPVDLTARLDAIRCPTLVLVGENDPGTTPAMARLIQERIPGARLAVLPGARHCSAVEAAEAFNTALLHFLGSVA